MVMADLDAPSLADPAGELLHETPGNPLPEGAHAGLLRARDGKKLRYARFAATERPLKGTVVLLPGRNESIEKYFETIADLARRGLAVATLDWRGQGLSDRLLRNRQRGHVDRFDSYVRDLEQLFDEVVLPDCRGPFFILAHSTGALTALLAAPAMANRVRRMVLVAPLLALAGVPMSMKGVHRLAASLYWTGFGRLYLGGGPRSRNAGAFEGNVLTSDEQRYRRNQEIVRTPPRARPGRPDGRLDQGDVPCGGGGGTARIRRAHPDPDAARRRRRRPRRLDPGHRALRAAPALRPRADHRRRPS